MLVGSCWPPHPAGNVKRGKARPPSRIDTSPAGPGLRPQSGRPPHTPADPPTSPHGGTGPRNSHRAAPPSPPGWPRTARYPAGHWQQRKIRPRPAPTGRSPRPRTEAVSPNANTMYDPHIRMRSSAGLLARPGRDLSHWPFPPASPPGERSLCFRLTPPYALPLTAAQPRRSVPTSVGPRVHRRI